METKETAILLKPLLPELKGREAEVLYILGNGFDLYHGLNTRYSDFHDWLKEQRKPEYDYFINGMERLFPLETNPYVLWSNYENALGLYDIMMTYDDYHKDNSARYSNYYNQEMLRNVKSICGAIRPHMTSWAKNGINLNNAKKKIELSPNSWYFTFNYTQVLEDIYEIKDKQHVCHIHGSVSDGSYLITGHNYEQDLEGRYDDENDSYEIAMKSLIVEFNNQGKKPKEQIEKTSTQRFLKNIANVSHVVVIGHSLDEIDKEYFKEIQKKISKDAEWHFYIYQSKDRFTINKFTQDMSIGSFILNHNQKRGRDINLPNGSDPNV